MAPAIFLILGAMILLGFAGNLLFKKTKIPEILFLIIGGILIGPVLHIVDQAQVLVYAPFITALMLIVIMLDNGLSFNIFRVTKALPMTMAFSLGIMFLTFGVLTMVFHFFFSMSLLAAAIISLVISGTTTDVITILVSKMSVPAKTKQLVIFESVINDMQIIPFFILLHYAETSSLSAANTINALLFQIPLTIVISVVTARIWVQVIGKWLGKHQLNYVATLALLFILYDVSQMIGGNGVIAVLTFSLIFGNALHLFRNSRVPFQVGNKFTVKVLSQLKEIEIDISFFVKTIFFVFLGIIFSFRALEPGYIIMSLVILAFIVLCRYAVVHVLVRRDKSFSSSKGALVWMLPRGYVAAVLAFAAVSSNIFTQSVVDIALLNIFLTTFVAIAYAMYHGRMNRGRQ